MLGIFLIYYIGKSYYELADLHHLNKWGYAILGVLMYYFGTFIAGIGIAIHAEYSGSNYLLEDSSSIMINLIGLLVGILFTWGLYQFFKNKWSQKVEENTSLDEFAFE